MMIEPYFPVKIGILCNGMMIPSGKLFAIQKQTIETLDLPNKNGDLLSIAYHCYVGLPEGNGANQGGHHWNHLAGVDHIAAVQT